jgi:anti-sigma regulatory factor (Ser/Thr protein kinase)
MHSQAGPSSLLPSETIVLPREADSAAKARAWLCPLVAVDPDQGRFPDALLLLSELVSNSVQHAEGDLIQVLASQDDELLRIEVCDGGDGLPAVRRLPDHDDPHGRGLLLLDALADRWGTDRIGGACVWFEIAL